LKRLLKTCGVRIGRVVSIFSLALLLIAPAAAGPYQDLDAQLSGAKTDDEKIKILDQSQIANDDQFKEIVNKTKDDPAAVEEAEEYVSLKAMAEAAGDQPDQSARIRQIKSSAVYRDEGKKESANWLQGAINRMKNLFRQKPRTDSTGNGPDLSANWGAIGLFLIQFVWFLLGAAVLAFIVYAIRFVTFGRLKHRRAKAMLEDDEPERTLDEWLVLADSLERDGRCREAVRALYLACLLKFDEQNIARFVRSQTNWEHLARIDNSPRRPPNLDFRTPTQAFDRIWYGYKVRGSADVDDFRAWYGQVATALRREAA